MLSTQGYSDNLLSVDTETTGIYLKHGCKPFLISTTDPVGNSRYWEIPVDPFTREPQIKRTTLLDVRKYLSGKRLIFHHAKFDITALATIGLFLSFPEKEWPRSCSPCLLCKQIFPYSPVTVHCAGWEDTFPASHVHTSKGTHNLKELALLHLDYPEDDEEALYEEVKKYAREARKRGYKLAYKKGSYKDGKPKPEFEADYWLPKVMNPKSTLAKKYACCDTERTMLLWQNIYSEMIQDDPNRARCYYREKSLIPVIYGIEQQGITISKRSMNYYHKKLSDQSGPKRKIAERIAAKVLGVKKFNLASPPQMHKLLYSKEGFNFAIPKFTEKGNPSTDAEALGILADRVEEGTIPHKFLTNTAIYKKYSTGITYLDSYKHFILPSPDESRWVLYPTINPNATDTTRMGSSNPNGQNVCFDGDTELLTEDGWVKASVLKENTKIAQYNAIGKSIHFVKPGLVKKHYKGKMHHITTEQQIDMMLTPAHRCLLRNRRTGNLKVVPARQFKEDYQHLHAGFYVDGEKQLSLDEVTFICAVQADGSYHKSKGYDCGLRFIFKKKRKYERLIACLDRLGVSYNTNKKGGLLRIYVYTNDIHNKMIRGLMHSKKFGSWLLQYNQKTLKAISKEIFFWDGDYTREAMFSSSDKENVDWVQIICSLTGTRSWQYSKTPDTGWSTRKHHYLNITQDKDNSMTTNFSVAYVDWDDWVYCVTVPSTFVLTRRNGRVSVTGNSKQEESPLRNIFSPPEGKVWIPIDYQQLQLRIFAFVTQEKSLIRSFREGYDFHATVATGIFKKPRGKITEIERRIAKNTNFALIFGAGKSKVNRTAGIPTAYEDFSNQYTNVARFLKGVTRTVRKQGYVETPYGYPLDVDRYKPYAGGNYIIQGAEGDIVKNAMILIVKLGLVTFDPHSKYTIIMQIHDELIIECNEDYDPVVIRKIMGVMEMAGTLLNMETPVDASIVRLHWGKKEKLKYKPIKPNRKVCRELLFV